ncbi:cation diffusion zinc membrane transporter Zrg17 [Saxophila tyrrhenica]|uniref:Zinc transporter n=1 Tax=Saxophila tyrrhenica TaxID=1690608 RepID=A0AAV9PCI1_9PEZI|nr:cation diffusion zinc membrane transporter Zrg17 [Saxophila tyrrhenica]
MAPSTLPLPRPPGTPPPTDDNVDGRPKGLGLDGPTITTDYDYDIQKGITDSPSKEPDSGRTYDSGSSMLSPTHSTFSGLSPNPGFYTPITPQTASTDGGFPQHASLEPSAAGGQRNPFNFTTQQYEHVVRKPSNEALGKRRGHKYRHSSIHASAMDSIIQAPTQRTPLTVPSSLPIPTRKETWRSLTPHQTLRLAWCACHFLVSAFVQFSAAGSLSMTALSRLLLFDAAGATVCVVVDVMANFEVWQRSSIKHPFGLARADVLAGFGMAVFIAFMGLDILSHGIEHALENLGTHEPHTSHAHGRLPMFRVDVASLLSICATLTSALLLQNHKRIGKATNFTLIASWGRILGNPSHILTLSCSLILLILPLLSSDESHSYYTIFDTTFSFLIACLMLTLGLRLGTSLAAPLLMSYKPPASGKHKDVSVRDIVTEIEGESGVSGVEEAKFWQVHYGLCMANLKLRWRGGGGAEEMSKVRGRVVSLVRQRLGGKWEVSLQMAVERD